MGYMLSLAAYRVVGIESNGITISELFGQLETTPKITKWCGGKLWQHDRRSVFEGVFFELTPDNLGPVSRVYDRATLVALPADMRTRYADRVTSLTNTAPQLLVRFEYDPVHMSGSPFAVSTTELEQLYNKHYRFEELSRKDVIDHHTSFQMRGLKHFEEVAWRLILR